MIQSRVKRAAPTSVTCNKGMKKLRRNVDIDQETISITLIENLANELFYELFDYLDGCDIYRAFSNLNYRFQQLLNSSSLLFKIKLYLPSNELYENTYKQIILLNRHKIFSFCLYIPLKNDHFYSSFSIDSSLYRLESLFLKDLDLDLLMSVLVKLPSLPRLSSLFIGMSTVVNDLTDIYRIVLILPMLKYYHYQCSTGSLNLSMSLPLAINQQFSPIESLVIDHYCSFEEFSDIISYTPQLRRLTATHGVYDDLNTEINSSIILSNLTHLSLRAYDLTFDEFEIFISKIHSKLKVLDLSALSNDIVYLDAARWEQLILKYCPKFEKFYLKYYEDFDYENESSVDLGEPNQFTSAFWIERQWVFETESEFHEIIYSVRPYKERWYEYDGQFKVVTSSSNQLSKSTRLILNDIPCLDCQDLITINISRALTIAQYYHLEIPENEIFNGALIRAVALLPELTTLKIHSLSLYEPRDLCEEEIDIFLLTEDTSKIVKVYLMEMNEIQEIYFLMSLCPYMQYLILKCINDMDVELFVRQMLDKINFEHNRYLRLLCFRVPAADDEIIKKLEKMINTEKLIVDYSIKRVLDNIYLQWK